MSLAWKPNKYIASLTVQSLYIFLLVMVSYRLLDSDLKVLYNIAENQNHRQWETHSLTNQTVRSVA